MDYGYYGMLQCMVYYYYILWYVYYGIVEFSVRDKQ